MSEANRPGPTSDRVDRPLHRLAAAAPPTPPALSALLEAELGGLTAVRTRRPLRQLAMLIAVSLAYGAGVLALVSTRRDAGELPLAWMIGAGLAWFAGFAVPMYLALVPRAGSVLGRWELAGVAAAITAVAFIALGFTIHPSGPSSLQFGAAHVARGHTCLEIGLATALVPIALGAVFLRGALPVGGRWIAAALGAGGGSLGGLVLHLHCRVTDPLHVGLAHGGVVLVAAVLAAALAPRVTE
jgi:hypothetical protein